MDVRTWDVAECPGRNLVNGPFWSNNQRYKLDIVINARANRNICLKGQFINSKSTFFKLCTFKAYIFSLRKYIYQWNLRPMIYYLIHIKDAKFDTLSDIWWDSFYFFFNITYVLHLRCQPITGLADYQIWYSAFSCSSESVFFFFFFKSDCQ